MMTINSMPSARRRRFQTGICWRGEVIQHLGRPNWFAVYLGFHFPTLFPPRPRVEPKFWARPRVPKRQRTGAVQDAPRISEVIVPRTSVLDCGGPPPLWLWPTSDHWIAAGTQPPPPPRFNKESQKAGTEIFLIPCLPCLNCFLACLASRRLNCCILSITQKSSGMELPCTAQLPKLTG